MSYETRILSLLVAPESARIFDERATRITITDRAAGEFVEIVQDHEETAGTVSVDADNWPAIRDAVDLMMAECRPEKADEE